MVQLVEALEQYAKENKIPIMQPDGIAFLLEQINQHHCTKILEIGTAIGYSAIRMALLNKQIHVTTIEKDPIRYEEARKNIKNAGLEEQITVILGDAGKVEITGSYDLIFLDGPKAQYISYFQKYEPNLTSDGIIVTDNLAFHGLVAHPETIRSKDLRALVRKITNYIEFLKDQPNFHTDFYEIGDGISVTTRKTSIN